MDNRTFDRIGAVSAAVVAGASLLYAIAYLGLTPADQRGSDVDKFFRSYLAHPEGLRIASLCLFVSGVLSGWAVVAVARRIEVAVGWSLGWAAITGVVAGFATAAHGLGGLIGEDKLAHRYATGNGVTRAAVVVTRGQPSPVDPRGLATFAMAGLVVVALGLALRRLRSRLGVVGVVLGADMIVLFVATALGVDSAILITGGLASVLLGPVWWLGVASLLWRPSGAAPARPPAADPITEHSSKLSSLTPI